MANLSLRFALRDSKHKLIGFIVTVAFAAVVYFVLTKIDLIVHGQLYSYGLVFSAEWADSYRVCMWTIYLCLLSLVALRGTFLVRGLLRASGLARGIEIAEGVELGSLEPQVWAKESSDWGHGFSFGSLFHRGSGVTEGVETVVQWEPVLDPELE